MAFVRIIHEDKEAGTEISFEVHADESFPDAIAQCAAECRRLFESAMVEPGEVE